MCCEGVGCYLSRIIVVAWRFSSRQHRLIVKTCLVAHCRVSKFVGTCESLNTELPFGGNDDTGDWTWQIGSEQSFQWPEQERDLLLYDCSENIDVARLAFDMTAEIQMTMDSRSRLRSFKNRITTGFRTSLLLCHRACLQILSEARQFITVSNG
jgi:hypothetical protein